MPKADLHHYLNQQLIAKVHECIGTARGQTLLVVGANDSELVDIGSFLHRFSLVTSDLMGAVYGNYDQVPFASGECDVVIAWQVVDRAQQYFHVMHELARIIKPGGKVVLVNINALRSDMSIKLRGSASKINTLTQIMLAADQCHLAIECIERVGLFTQPHPWLKTIEQLCLPYAGGLSLGYIAVFERHEVGLTPLVAGWVKDVATVG